MQAGYNPDASHLHFYGMAHSALSGAGWGEMGEVRLVPLSTSADDGSTFLIDEASVEASPGYIAFEIEQERASSKIGIQSTATTHAAVHRITYPQGKASVKIVLPAAPDSSGGYVLKKANLSVVSDSRIEGCALDTCGIDQAVSFVCFVFEFDHPFRKARVHTSTCNEGATCTCASGSSRNINVTCGCVRPAVGIHIFFPSCFNLAPYNLSSPLAWTFILNSLHKYVYIHVEVLLRDISLS